MPKRILFVVHLEEKTIYELRRVWQESSLSWSGFIEAVMNVGLIQFEGITGAAVDDMQAEKQQEQFLMNWRREDEECVFLHEIFPEEEG
jgi:hypothetical protein